MPAPPLTFNKRFAADVVDAASTAVAGRGGNVNTGASSLTSLPNRLPPTATSVLKEVDARERTLAVHGVVPSSTDALLDVMRGVGHVVRVARSKQCATTIYITFGSALAAQSAAELQGNAVVDGQRFAVSSGALLEDEVQDEEVTETERKRSTIVTSPQKGSTGPVGIKRVATQDEKPVEFQKVKYSHLTCLPFADRWLIPLLRRSAEGDTSRKRDREGK
jgi:hypothetical protein